MITTLLKHEFRGTRSLLGLAFAICTLATGVGSLAGALGWPVIRELGIMLALLGTAGLLYAVSIVLVIWYYRSSYGRGGYLTQSIPVKGSTLYWVKVLYAGAVLTVSLMWAALLGLVTLVSIATGGDGSAVNLSELSQAWAQLTTAVPAWMWIAFVLFALFSQVTTLVPYFFAISIGSESRFARLGFGGPVLVWFIFYIALQLVMVATMFIPLGIGPVNGRLGFTMTNFIGAMFSGAEPQSMPIGFLPVQIAVMIALMWRTHHSWNNKLSLT